MHDGCAGSSDLAQPHYLRTPVHVLAHLAAQILHVGAVACTMDFRWGEPARSQSVLSAPIALIVARKRAPSAAGPPMGNCDGVRPAASGWQDRDSGCRLRVERPSSRPAGAVVDRTSSSTCLPAYAPRRRQTSSSEVQRTADPGTGQRQVSATADIRPRNLAVNNQSFRDRR